MNRFREIGFVRLPGNRFWRRHMSPKGIRPGITWSRRWTVNLVTAGGARRAVAFINKSFLILKFWDFSNFRKKNLYPEFEVWNVRKTSRSSKKWKFEQKISARIWDFQISRSAIYIRITPRILHLPLELLTIPKKISKIKISLFQKWSAIELWDNSFPEAEDQWEYF